MSTTKSKMTRVMVFGSFDVIHPGHLHFFRQARQFADKLIVVLARDNTIKKIKGREPHHDEKTRLSQIQELPIVDLAMLGSMDDPYAIILQMKPEVICLGHDQDSFTDNLDSSLKKRGVNIRIERLRPYKRDRYRSSLIKKNLGIHSDGTCKEDKTK